MSVAFADDFEQGEVYIEVSGQEGTLYCSTDGEAAFNIFLGNFSASSEAFTLNWIDTEPEGVSWKVSEDCAKLLINTTTVTSCSGEYKFSLSAGEITSNEVSLNILSVQFPIPESGCSFEYDSHEHSVIDKSYDFAVSGTASATDAGTYSAVVSLPENINCTWADGSIDPINVSFEITPRQVTVSGILAESKICDGTDTAELNTDEAVFDGLVEGDELSCNATGFFDNPKVGGGKKVLLTLELTGKDAGNYVLSPESQSEAKGTIIRCTEEGDVECVTNPDANYRNGSVTETDEEFLDIVMNQEMKTLVKNGADLKVWLSVSDITECAPDYDVYKVNSAKGDSTVAAYLDINIYKQFGNDEEAEKIPEIENEITIEMDMPKSLVNSDRNITRTYQLIRVHNGVAETLDVEYNKDTNTFTFNTDRFSTYALTFTDVDKPFSPAVVFANDGNYSVLWVIGFLLLCSKGYGIYLQTNAYARRKSNAYHGRH